MRQLAILLATGATVGLVAPGIFGAWTWTDLNQRLEEEQLIRTLSGALLVFGIAAVVFGALCVAGFALVQRCLHRPLEKVEIGYRTNKPLVPGGEGPFLREERALLDGAELTHRLLAFAQALGVRS